MGTGACRCVETAVLEDMIEYTGAELRSHFVRARSGIAADGVVAFLGPCGVAGAALVDLEDAERGSEIDARLMLHFIGEHFQCPLREGNVRLRLFAAIVRDAVAEAVPGARPERRGDDLFVDRRKLTVAIATVTPVSLVFHFGVNVDPAGAPVPAIGLGELGIDPVAFARLVLDRYADECASIELALRKVRGVP